MKADERDPARTRRLGSLGGAKPKRPRDELPILQTQGPRIPPPGAGTQPGKPVTDWFLFDMPTPTYPGPGRQPPGARTQPVTFEMPNPTYLGPAKHLPGTGTQLATDRFAYELPPWTRTQPGLDQLRDNLPDMPNSVPGYDKLPPRADVYDFDRSPEADLMDTVRG